MMNDFKWFYAVLAVMSVGYFTVEGIKVFKTPQQCECDGEEIGAIP